VRGPLFLKEKNMALNGIGISGSIVHATASPQGPYAYRSGMGMVPSTEFQVLFDDFTSLVTTNVPNGWTAAIIDTGATAVASTTAALGANGALLMSDATASEGVAVYMPKAIQLTVGKRFFMEMRVRTSDVTDNAVQFGLTDLTATTNPEDLWTTTAANVISFGILDGSAVTGMLSDAGNSGTTVQAGARSMVADTWHILAIQYDGVKLRAYVDGKLSLLWSGAASTVPTGVALAPFIGVLNGDGAGAAVNTVDYLRYVSER
jgi:hypothetical protein